MKCKSEITLTYKGGASEFRGKVKSDEKACVTGRTVFLYKDKKKDAQVGDTITTNKGAYSFRAVKKDVKGDTFYTKVGKETRATEEGEFSCGKAKSKSVTP